MIQNSLQGTGVALVTPFTLDNKVDYTALKKLLEHVIAGGVEFLVVFGTTGEPITLKKDERKEILEVIHKTVNGRLPIVVGCGGNNTEDVIERLDDIDSKKFDAILSVVPYYNKPSQEGIFQHYKAIAEASVLPVIAYNVPSRTGVNMNASTAIRVANIPNVIGLKEASPSVEQFTYIKKDIPEGFLLLSGDDSLIVPHMAVGAVGAISVTANAAPRQYSDMVRACKAGKFDIALKAHLNLIEFTDSLFTEGSPAGVKAALNQLGIMEQVVRMPLQSATPKHYDYIKDLLNNI